MSQKMPTRYSASFTAGSLLHKETVALLPLLQSSNAEQHIKDEIKNNKRLHINSESARKRTVYEIIKRTEWVEPAIWDFYASCSEEEQKALLFYVCLKTYALMFDFHFNVTLKLWNSSSQAVTPYFYQMELDEIAARDEQVDKWTDITKRKAISVYLRILKEIKLLNASNEIQPIHLADHFWRYFVNKQEFWFLEACLLSNREKERLMQL
ncbi:MAG: DUF1819 family protein [Tannerella sp.]|jgi:hypothetical protein|nr:DUF1819 family protein [Tannerella sp.]